MLEKYGSFIAFTDRRMWPVVKVEAVDMKSGLTQKFKSIKEAGETLGVAKENIPAVVRGTRRSAGGFTFSKVN